jgi:hypothetical protein
LIEGTHREYSLGYFGINATGAETGQRIYENGMRYFPPHLYVPYGNCTMVGYWQTEKYFESIAAKVRAAFEFRERRSILPCISLHVRRQDYVGLQHFHGMPGIEYYQEAVALIRREVGRPVPVMVFSDDIQWCRENLPSDFLISDSLNKYEDLRLMASCDYHVIANSSFSWWGAWLGPQKLVVAPKRWFTDLNTDYSDIVPERWVKL